MEKENKLKESLILNKGKLLISGLLFLLLTWGCTEENEDEMILGLWEIELFTPVKETLNAPHTPIHSVNFEDIGRIFFRSNGEGVLQIYDERYPNFEYHDIGVTHFTWQMEDDQLYINGDPGSITQNSWRELTFEVITFDDENRYRMVYQLKSKIIQ
jgi:hypothetical protein